MVYITHWNFPTAETCKEKETVNNKNKIIHIIVFEWNRVSWAKERIIKGLNFHLRVKKFILSVENVHICEKYTYNVDVVIKNNFQHEFDCFSTWYWERKVFWNKITSALLTY